MGAGIGGSLAPGYSGFAPSPNVANRLAFSRSASFHFCAKRFATGFAKNALSVCSRMNLSKIFLLEDSPYKSPK
jgi:hypothetical protein